MKRLFILLFLIDFALRAAAQTGAGTVKLALVAESPDASAALDVLTAQLSSESNIQLLERNEIQKIFNEQVLSSENKDFSKLGQLLGADGLLILSLEDKDGRQVLSSRLIAVKPGVEVGLADYDFPLADPVNWGKLIDLQFTPLLPKLTVLRHDAVPISILNVRSAAASADGDILERQLTLLLHDRLMSDKDLFVLERRNMEALTFEKELIPAAESAFWNGSYLIEGTIDPQGYNKDTVTVNIQLTAPGQQTVKTLEASGPRTNLTQVISDLSAQVAQFVNKAGTAANWNPDKEANRYFEEAKWMLRWSMFEEAKAASEAAWALGKQDRDSAAIRVQAYQGCAGDPGKPRVDHGIVVFAELPRVVFRGIPASGGMTFFATAPPDGGILASIRATELWLDGVRNFNLPGKKLDKTWFDLGATNLDQSSKLLRYYYFNAEARNGAEDNIRRARELCREEADTLGQMAPDSEAVAVVRLTARYAVFWSESPEETLRVYRSIVDKGKWPLVCARFYNGAYNEVIRTPNSFVSRKGHEISEVADECKPALGGWSWAARRRCPELWNSFITELCSSDKPLVKLDGLLLKSSYAWSQADYLHDIAQAKEFIQQNLDAIAGANMEEELIAAINQIGEMRNGGHVSSAEAGERNAYSIKLREQIRAAYERGRGVYEANAKKEQLARELKAQEEYLQSQTNFDFMSFAKVMMKSEYASNAPDRLLPLLTNYHERIKAFYKSPAAGRYASNGLWTAETWLNSLEEDIKSRNKPPVIVTNNNASINGRFVGSSQRNMPQGNASAAPKTMSTISPTRFWKLPPLTNNFPNQGPHYGSVSSCCYRDGRLWVQELYSDMSLTGVADFYGVDLNTFDSKHVTYQGENFAMWDGLKGRAERQFDVEKDYLYLWLKDSVRRYSFARNAWENFPAPGDAHPRRSGDRLFFVNSSSIQELMPDGSLKLIASCRRRPAENAIDKLEILDPCHIFLDAKGRINVFANFQLFAPVGADDWQLYGTIPGNRAFYPEEFGDGLIQSTYGETWGIFGQREKPELLFRTPTAVRPVAMRSGSPGQDTKPAADWKEPPPELSHPCTDGDCLWYLGEPRQSGQNTTPYAPHVHRAPDANAAPMFVRYKLDDPHPLRIALDLSADKAAESKQPGVRLRNDWNLAATPEGLVAFRRGEAGIWFFQRDELNRAVAEAEAHRSTNP